MGRGIGLDQNLSNYYGYSQGMPGGGPTYSTFSSQMMTTPTDMMAQNYPSSSGQFQQPHFTQQIPYGYGMNLGCFGMGMGYGRGMGQFRLGMY